MQERKRKLLEDLEYVDGEAIQCTAAGGGFRQEGCTCVWVGVLVAQLCSTLQPTESSPPGSPVHGSLQASMLQWVAMPFSKGSSWPRDQTWVSSIAGRFFTIWTTGGPTIYSQFQERKQIFEHWCWQASGCGGSCGCSLLCKVGSKIVIRGVRRWWRVEERGKGMKSLSRKSRELMG